VSQENVVLVRGFYGYFNRKHVRNLDTVAADFEWHAREDFPDARIHVGSVSARRLTFRLSFRASLLPVRPMFSGRS
jgi:ketosteroid isomerase-like protein